MKLSVPPHPGPAPGEFDFPFREAGSVIAAAEALGEAIAVTVDRHHEAAHAARGGFEGVTRQEFDAGLAEVTARLDGDLAVLRGDLAALENDIALARQRREASLDAIHEHAAALDAHREAVAAPAP